MLVCGDADGQLDTLFTIVGAQEAKAGPFAALFCVGRFWPPEDASEELKARFQEYVEGKANVPVPTYVCCATPHAGVWPLGKQIAPNLTILGTSGIETIVGLRVAHLAGIYDSTCYHYGGDRGKFGKEALVKLEAECEENPAHGGGTDLLLSCEWPKCLEENLIKDHPPILDAGTEAAGRATAAANPRYLICGGEGNFYQRAPFVTKSGHVCRTVCLAPVGTKGQKWLHALQLTPMRAMDADALTQKPVNTTDSPSSCRPHGAKRGAEESEDAPQKKQKEVVKIDTAPHHDCWFCLANPKVEKHLTVGLGREVYVAVAKGPICPGHCLVIPVRHIPRSIDAPERDQMKIYIEAVRAMLAARGEDCVVSERWIPSRNALANHMHFQVVPVDPQHSPNARACLEDLCQKLGLRVEPIRSMEDIGKKVPRIEIPYVYFELPGMATAKGKSIERFLVIGGGASRLPMSFQRKYVCYLIGQRQREDWRQCKQDDDEEAFGAKILRDQFKKFDPKNQKKQDS